MTKFTIGSQWKTRGGWRAVVVGENEFKGGWKDSPYFIYVCHCNTYALDMHDADGKTTKPVHPKSYDLIEPWVDPKEYDVWVNVHMGPYTIITSAWTKKEDADKFGTDDRIACINVKFKEGDGL